MSDRSQTDPPVETPPELNPADVIDRDTVQAAETEDIAGRAGVGTAVVESVVMALAEFECERKPWRDPRVLARLYYREGLSQREIGEQTGATPRNISYWMGKYEMPTGQVWNANGTEDVGDV